MSTFIILTSIFLPIVAGIILECFPDKGKEKRNLVNIYTTVVMALVCVLTFLGIGYENATVTLFSFNEKLPIFFKIDRVGILFSLMVSVVWVLSGIFSFEYMKHEDKEKRFFGFYVMVMGVLIGLTYAGNLVTFYFFYELMTLCTVPMVIHSGRKEATMAGYKYLFYSLFGAYCALFGFYFLYKYAGTLNFTFGGTLALEAGSEGVLLTAAFMMILGFGVKAGMFPMHAWLPTAHPVAPAPASAVLSGIIVKAGVLGILRTAFYLFGADFIRGTWVQTTWMILALFTVFMGSTLAYKEQVIKKRFAYSTVSQVSYILFGLSLLVGTGVEGGLLHALCHAFAKCGLFLTAGAIIYMTGKTKVSELKGIGKQMPVTMWCFTIFGLTLIGIPPTGGFMSKWYLCVAAFETGLPVFRWLGPVILLISALLTAGYLLPITVDGFFPGKDFDYKTLESKEPKLTMLIPLITLAVLSVLSGVFADNVVSLFNGLLATLR